MRIRGAAVSVSVVFVIAAALSGCVSAPPAVTSTPRASFAPVFASDAEALAAAKKAYAGYTAADEVISSDGGRDAIRIAPWVTPQWLPHELKPYADLEKTGNRIVGGTSVTAFSKQRVDQAAEGKVVVVAYICLDISKSRVLSSEGVDITPASRPDTGTLMVSFANRRPRSRTLLVDGSETWEAKDVCP